MVAEGTFEARSVVEDSPTSRRVISIWLVAAVVGWTGAVSVFVLAISGFPMLWPTVVALVGLVGLGAWGVRHPAVCSFIERRTADLLMVASVAAAAALATFSTSIEALGIWFIVGSTAFSIAVFGLFTIVRHPLRSIGLIAGYVIVLLFFLPALNQPASELGLQLRLLAVRSDYEAAARSMLDAPASDDGSGGNIYDVNASPKSGRVLNGPSGEPAVVVWTWTQGLALHHPRGIVFDPDGRLRGDGRFQSSSDQLSLEHCERLSGKWWWCAQY